MKTYVEMVNLARATDRRAHMQRELAMAGVDCIFSPGVDYSLTGKDALLQECRPDGPLGPFPAPHMAATLSHARIWERFLATDCDYCVVFEDDVHISPDLKDWLSDMRWWPEDADVVKLERWRDDRLFVLMEPEVAVHLGRRIRRLLSRHVGAAGYILTRKAAQSLLDARPYDIVIDHLIFNFMASRASRGLKIYQIDPALVVQGNEPAQSNYRMGKLDRAQGLQKMQVKLSRGLMEIGFPPSTWAKVLTGRARFSKIQYSPAALSKVPPGDTVQSKRQD